FLFVFAHFLLLRALPVPLEVLFPLMLLFRTLQIPLLVQFHTLLPAHAAASPKVAACAPEALFLQLLLFVNNKLLLGYTRHKGLIYLKANAWRLWQMHLS